MYQTSDLKSKGDSSLQYLREFDTENELLRALQEWLLRKMALIIVECY